MTYHLSSPANYLTQLIDIMKDHIFIHCLTHSAATCTASLSHTTHSTIDEASMHLKLHFKWENVSIYTITLANNRTAWTAGSLGTVLSETVTMVSLSAPPTVACSAQLGHCRTAKTISISKP